MKLTLAVTAAMLPLAACSLANGMSGDVVQPSGSGTTRNFDVSGFTGVSLRGEDDVEVRTGPAFKVTATGDSALLDRLEIRKDGDTLRIGRKDGDWRWGGDKGAKITVTLPRLTNADVAGSGDMTVDRAEGDFDGSIAGSGDLHVAAGQANQIDASIAGSGDLDAAALKAARGEFSIAGSGNIRAQVTGEADISIVGSGDVELSGGAKCSVSAMGSGEARCN